MAKATLDDLKRAVERHIERRSDHAYDCAANSGQLLDNVKHMDWFKKALARWLIDHQGKYAHLELP